MKIDWGQVETPPTDTQIARAEAVQLAKDQLKSTDWYVIRMIEVGTEVPEEVKTQRAASRATLSQE